MDGLSQVPASMIIAFLLLVIALLGVGMGYMWLEIRELKAGSRQQGKQIYGPGPKRSSGDQPLHWPEEHLRALPSEQGE